jgi:5-methyltetrahydrofolate--homocysteine methyltransferase
MTVSVDNRAAGVTLGALSYIRNILGCNTVLGVSNISFGLPSRDGINSAFFAMALERGLSAAIMNPFSYEMMRTYYSFRALKGYDEMCKDYIEFSQTEEIKVVEPTLAAKQAGGKRPEKNTLSYAVERGLRDKAAECCKKMLEDNERPLDIVNGEIIPALDRVGEGFEKGTLFLPSLLMSAEAAKAAFEVIKASSENEKKMTQNGKTVVIATVKGDIHDIGKNIVKLLFENYGYNVVDLGKNVDPSDVLKSVIDNDAKICVLSALMTTTVAAMEETVALVKREAPFCKTIVGGAVLTEEYANKMGADKYAPDAISAVKYAEQI